MYTMSQRTKDLEVFAQPSFLAALLVLVLNDLYLKTHYPNWITGKLSDFAGLYVFTYATATFFGLRVTWAALASAVVFIYWKSPLATPLIELANQYSPLQVRRTIDYSDFLALAVLPLAVRLYGIRKGWRWSLIKYPAAAVAMLAIMATSVLPPSYNVRFDLKDIPDRRATIGDTYMEVDRFLVQRGMQCTICAEGSVYREYFNARESITVKLNYDSADRKLFVSLHTDLPDTARGKVDGLQVELMELLRPKFQNVTVVREATKFGSTIPDKAAWELKIEAPSVGFPLSCSGNGINHPEIAKALAIFDDYYWRLPTAINLRAQVCHPSDARCSLEMCRYVAFGGVTGPNRSDRSIHASTRGYVGWGGTSLYIEVKEYGTSRGGAGEFVDNLERLLRKSLGSEIPISVARPNAQQGAAGDAPRAARP